MTCFVCHAKMHTKRLDGYSIAQCPNKFCGHIEVLGSFARTDRRDHDGRALLTFEPKRRKRAQGE